MQNFHFDFEPKDNQFQDFTPHIGDLQAEDEVIAIDFDEFDSGPEEDSIEGNRRKRLKHLRRKQVYDPNQVVRSRFYVGKCLVLNNQLRKWSKLMLLKLEGTLSLSKMTKTG